MMCFKFHFLVLWILVDLANALAGGRQGKLPVAAFEVFDFATSKWRQLPDVPSKRVFAFYAHSDSHVYSVGGLNADAKQGFSDVTEVFDLEKGMRNYDIIIHVTIMTMTIFIITITFIIYCCILLFMGNICCAGIQCTKHQLMTNQSEAIIRRPSHNQEAKV